MTLHGIGTVARLELIQRVRGTRWMVILGTWVVLIGLVTAVTRFALRDSTLQQGPQLYDITVFMVLALGMLVVPALSSTSVNSDREHGVLATLQTTLLSPADIILGKLAAAWAVAMVFLAAAVPFLIWAWIEGGVGVASILRALGVMALVLAVVCSLGLWFSTRTARPVLSTALTYLTLAGLVFGTLFTFAVTAPLVTTKEDVRYYGINYDSLSPDVDPQTRACEHLTRRQDVLHTERTWWLLAINPFVVVADAATARSTRTASVQADGIHPLLAISDGVRQARKGPTDGERQECWTQGDDRPTTPISGPVWPIGLATLILIGAAATAWAISAIRTPVRRLPHGTRIA